MITLYDSARRVNHNAFGRGILPARPRHEWASDREWLAHYLGNTLSADDYHALRAEADAERTRRHADAHEAEAAELGISAEAMEELAEEAALLDRVCGIPTPAATAAVEVRTVQVRGNRYVAELIAAEDEEVIAAVRLTGPAGQVYDVARTVHGITCTCPDFIFKREGLTGEPCKHGVACNAYGLLDAPAPKPARKPRPRTLRQRNQEARRAVRKAAVAS